MRNVITSTMGACHELCVVVAIFMLVLLLSACGDDSSSVAPNNDEPSSSGVAQNSASAKSSSSATSRSSEKDKSNSSSAGREKSSVTIISGADLKFSSSMESSSSEKDLSSSSVNEASSSSLESNDSSSSSETPKKYAEAKVMPSGTYDCSEYNCFSTEYLNQEFLEAGKYGEILDERDGQVYKVVEIDDQVWMAQNLNYADSVETPSLLGRSWCYDNESANCSKYGRLYTWAVVIDSAKLASDATNPRYCGSGTTCEPAAGKVSCSVKTCGLTETVQGICPTGWHLPSYDEWNTLLTALNDSSATGTKLKSQSGWNDNGNGTNVSGFSALPAGFWNCTFDNFYDDGNHVSFWSSKDNQSYAYYLGIGNDYARLGDDFKNMGLSVRCLKD